MIHYRKSTAEDIPRLTDLRVEFLNEVSGEMNLPEKKLRIEIEGYLREKLTTGAFLAWVALMERRIIATSGLSFYRVPPSHTNWTGRVGYIMNMYTVPEERGHGIATTLFQKMIEEGERAGVGKLVLHTTPTGRSLYRRFGFQEHNDEMVLTMKV